MTLPPIVCLMGPTASGKTDLALQLCQHSPFEIISVDSALVYKGMDIGTAKPAVEIRQAVPHRLIDILDPSQAYSAANFCRDAEQAIAEIHAAQRIPLLVGGTMLYFRALLSGLAPMPSADPSLRAAIQHEADAQGWGALHAQLQQIDPDAAARIHPNDPQRIGRALEVFRLTGTPISAWQRDSVNEPKYSAACLGLLPSDRKVLHQRIAQRFDWMLTHGFIDEVQRLRSRGDLNLALPAMRAVGYRQVWEYLDGKYAFDTLVDKALTATRQLAKRQLTWLRAMPDVIHFDCLNNGLENEVLKALRYIRIIV